MSEPLPDLRKTFASRRRFANSILSVLAFMVTAAALVPLFSVLYTLAVEGGQYLMWDHFFGLPPVANESRKNFVPGFGNALQGTLVMVGLASVLSVPIGILAAIYMSEFAPHSRLTLAARFAAKMLTGLPSVIAGVFGYALLVRTMGHPSAYAGGVALALLMLPTVVLTAEEALRQVPMKVREAATALGATPAQVVWKVVLPACRAGLITGVLLAVARAAGETAPLIFTAEFSFYWMRGNLDQATPSMAMFVYNNYGQFDPKLVRLAWVASFVLVAFILILNLTARWLGRQRH